VKKEYAMTGFMHNEKGSALVTTLFFLLGLAVTGAIIAGIASSERRVTNNEYTHTRSFNASDAGGEVGINWIRTLNGPQLVPYNTVVQRLNSFDDLTTTYTDTENNAFRYDVTFDRRRFRPGWSREYKDYDFTIDSEGESSQESATVIQVQASRLFRDQNSY
jgi:Tfp pilus assembly protein PilX